VSLRITPTTSVIVARSESAMDLSLQCAADGSRTPKAATAAADRPRGAG